METFKMAKYKKLLSVILCDDCSKAFKIFKKLDDTLITNGYILEKKIYIVGSKEKAQSFTL